MFASALPSIFMTWRLLPPNKNECLVKDQWTLYRNIIIILYKRSINVCMRFVFIFYKVESQSVKRWEQGRNSSFSVCKNPVWHSLAKALHFEYSFEDWWLSAHVISSIENVYLHCHKQFVSTCQQSIFCKRTMGMF